MRLAFAGLGLLGLLMTVAIMMYMSAQEAETTLPIAAQARSQVEQIAGVDANGNKVEDSYALTPIKRADGKTKSLQVTRIDPGSPLQKFFGLQKDDLIVTAIYNGVQWDMPEEPDDESAELKVREAYVRSGQLIVTRLGRQITLPDKTVPVTPVNPGVNPQGNPPANPVAAGPAAAPQQTPATPESDPLKAINDRLHSLSGN